MSPAHPTSTLLSLPVEIRLRIYKLLFHCAETLLIETAHPPGQQNLEDEHAFPQERSPPTLRICPLRFCRPAYLTQPHSSTNYGLGLSSQLLLTCRQIYTEALRVLYSLNRFGCSMRNAPTVLFGVISTTSFAHIRYLVLDWQQLQDFAWSLAKDEQVTATRGLEILEMNHPRTRVLRLRAQDERLGILPYPARPRESWRYQDRKSHERQLHQAALEICQKHATLRHVLQAVLQKPMPRGYQHEAVPAGNDHGLSRPIPEFKVTARIRWRFVTDKTLRDRRDDERVLDLMSELARGAE
ncbi:hypothetical protein H2200_011768 [Cladophialophora chaetospira]|uniref:DUF7730 domain-containing protein n=1 Tax=Cladophialophora chaetospira TaxID=386627 RepID=A0AA38WYN5_9EURO|nr:hypothetical protein H2200_011768 [Cladophialophora chaetospira]